MAKKESNMMPLGTIAPSFSLPDTVTDQLYTFSSADTAKASVIMFICNHCPYVKHINAGLVDLVGDYQTKGIKFIAINSNDVIAYPDDSPENMRISAKQNQYNFPYLFDESQEVAQAFDAACTPDFFIFNQEHKLVYRGQLDDSRPGNDIPVTGKSIRDALDAVLNNTSVSPDQIPSLGCSIKWNNKHAR